MRQAALQQLIKKSSSQSRAFPTVSTNRFFLSEAFPKNMKFYTALSVVATMVPLSGAWMSSSFISQRRVLSLSPDQRAVSTRWMSASAPSVEESSSTASARPSGATGKVLAEGTIVSQFPGGMAAVRINEDLTEDANAKPLPVLGQMSPELLAASKNSASSGDYQGKQVVFPNGSIGVVVAHRPPIVFCYSEEAISLENGMVQVMDSMARITVSPGIHQVDCFGGAIDGKTTTSDAGILAERAIFAPIPLVAHIALINNPMLSGNTMMDTLAPVGRGQNMLLIGHNMTQLRGLALDFVRTQIRASTKVVYASTEYDRETALKRLQDAGIADDVQFVGTKAGKKDVSAKNDEVSRAAEAVLIASTACSIGESYALQKGMHSLVVVDNIDLHKKFWDATTRVLVDVFGVDAVVKADREGGASSEMRCFYSSLIQRAGQYNGKHGGGSVTLLLLTSIPIAHADDDTVFQLSDFEQSSERMKERINLLVKKNIPLTAATLRKINMPIPTVSEGERRMVLQHIDDLISMSDGQVWFDETLEANGQQPPMDPQRSITRIGIGADTPSRADAPAIRRIAEGMRLELSQAACMVGTEVTAASRKQIRRQQALLLAMHQPAGSGGRRLSESCVALLAAKQGSLDKSIDDGAMAGTKEGETLMKNLLDHVQRTATGAMDEIDESLDISDEARTALGDSIASFFVT
jgi:F0F1-type ATP synthase alpha subunit